MPRRPPPTPAALEALGAAAQLCAQRRECEDLDGQRDELWEKAYSENATYEMIADRCGVSPHTVRLHVARVRGLGWATK